MSALVQPRRIMNDVDKPPSNVIITPVVSALRMATGRTAEDEAMKCERCGAEMYRMHAVWRCPACRFKTDCCGW
jgi:lipopolysaccharide biosynthesis regulator YciM